MARIYVSSTFLDLEAHRRAVSLQLRRMGHEDVAMEYYVAEDTRPVDKCLADVASCDVYIGLFAWRYGWVPERNNPDGISITEMEYRKARETNKKILIFTLDGKHPWPPDFIDEDRTQIKALRERLSEEHGNSLFFSESDLAATLSICLNNWAQERAKSISDVQSSNFQHPSSESYNNDHFADYHSCEDSLYAIDETLVRDYLLRVTSRGKDTPENNLPLDVALGQLGLCRNGILTKGAILLFGKNPQTLHSQATVKCARFKSTTADQAIDSGVIRGTLLNQVEKSIKFILKNIRKGWRIEGFNRLEKWEYPLESIREAVVNAVVHRDYKSSGNVQVRIFDDRLEIWSPGHLPEPLTVSDILKPHQSFPRNRLIAECFHNIGLIEGWGTGIQRIIDTMKAHGLSEPKFEEKPGSFVVTLTGPGPKFENEELDFSAYNRAVMRRYQRIDLDALTQPEREEYLQLQLRGVFVEQNVRENPPPVELPKEVWERLNRSGEVFEDLPRSLERDDLHRAFEMYRERPPQPVLDLMTDSNRPHIVILGDPGSGKSTLLRYVLLSLLDPAAGDERLRHTFGDSLPLLIELRSYAGLCAEDKCDTFIGFLDYLGKTEGWNLSGEALERYLSSGGRAVVLFDGLDEIFDPERREAVARQIASFAEDFPRARIVITSRRVGYRRAILSDAGFTHYLLQDLEEPQVAAFVDRWYGLALSDRPDEAAERRARILRSFRDSASIRQLAGNPMLLTIMAIIGKHQELPRERWKLYDHAASVLIQHWDVNKHVRDLLGDADFLGEDDKKELLRGLAYRIQASEGGLAGNFIHRHELQEEFEGYLKRRYQLPADRAAAVAGRMIEQFRARNFILSLYGANLYGFVHRAFLEFFCASAFVHRFEKTQELTLEELKTKVYGAHWEEQSWHEVLRLISGQIDESFTREIIGFLNRKAHNDPTEWLRAWTRELMDEITDTGS